MIDMALDDNGNEDNDSTGVETENNQGDEQPKPDNGGINPVPEGHTTLRWKFSVPKGKVVPGLLGVMTTLQSKFENFQIELHATDGEMSDQEYQKIKEGFAKLGIKPE